MNIVLYKTLSERERLNKTLTNDLTLTGTLRNESSVINPSFIIENANVSEYNYCYIQEFGRYYFINNITSIRYNLWKIDCSVDVLMSFKQQILDLDVIVSDLSYGERDESTYVLGSQWATTVKTKTDVLVFPNGLLETGEYILITSGGVAT